MGYLTNRVLVRSLQAGVSVCVCAHVEISWMVLCVLRTHLTPLAAVCVAAVIGHRFGGGEFQNGFLDYNNVPVQLVQFNTEAIVPFFVSSAGYGLLWDNYAWSHLNSAQAKRIVLSPVRG